MSIILVLTGANGAGKTTIAQWMTEAGLAHQVKTFTTRPKRFKTESEYHFYTKAKPPAESDIAWKISRGEHLYGMLKLT